MPKTLAIIQPGRIGDVIIVLPIAKHYHDQGHKIIWPVCTQYLPLFDYMDYVQSVDIGPEIVGSYRRALMITNGKMAINLAIGFGRDESDWRSGPLSFDEWKYKEAGLLITEKYKLAINRNAKKEASLIHVLGLDNRKGEYVVTHSDQASCRLHHDWNISGAIDIKPIDGYTVFDWLGVIENAKEVYCVDSCIANMINQLGIAKGKRWFRSWRQNFDYTSICIDPKGITDPHLDDGWKFAGRQEG